MHALPAAITDINEGAFQTLQLVFFFPINVDYLIIIIISSKGTACELLRTPQMQRAVSWPFVVPSMGPWFPTSGLRHSHCCRHDEIT